MRKLKIVVLRLLHTPLRSFLQVFSFFSFSCSKVVLNRDIFFVERVKIFKPNLHLEQSNLDACKSSLESCKSSPKSYKPAFDLQRYKASHHLL